MRIGVALLVALASAGCSADPPPSTAVVVAAPASRPPIQDGLVSASARPLPKGFVPDGAFDEWGSLDPPPGPEASKKPRPSPGTSPPKPASRVVVGLAPDRFAIAAELRKGARGGIWLSIGFDSGELGPLGTYQSGGSVGNDECVGRKDEGEAAVKACIDALEQESKSYQRKFAARFERTYRVDAGGIRLARAGELVLLDHRVKFATKEVGDAILVEAELPLLALPRVAESPVGSMNLAARPVEAAPAFAEHERVASEIDPPVALVGDAALRARIYEVERMRGLHFDIFHYQPGDESSVSVTGYGETGDGTRFDAHRYEEKEHPLFSRLQAFGDVEIGAVFPDGIATRRGDAIVAVESTHGKLLGLVPRDEKIHAFFFDQSLGSDTWLYSVSWTVLAISRDGAITPGPGRRNPRPPRLREGPRLAPRTGLRDVRISRRARPRQGRPGRALHLYLDLGRQEEALRARLDHDRRPAEAVAPRPASEIWRISRRSGRCGSASCRRSSSSR